MRLFQCDAIDLYLFVKKDGGVLAEDLYRLGGKETTSSTFGAQGIHLGMAVHVVGKAATHIVTLHDDFDMLGGITAYLVVEDGIVCTSEDECVNLIVLGQQIVDMAADEVVSAFALCLAILY